jgi:type III secretion system YscQ/HrcQ family protein
LIAQFRRPRLNSRLAIGLEVSLAHAIVNRLLGYERPFAESRLQLTPVEWGVWTYIVVRTLESLSEAFYPGDAETDESTRGLDRWDILLDRVGPDPFDATDLGAIVTLRWSVQVGSTRGAARLWLPESMLNSLLSRRSASHVNSVAPSATAREFSATWRALAGQVSIPQGLRRLRIGGVLPLADSRLAGTPQSPSGRISLVCDLTSSGRRFQIDAEPVAGSGGRLVQLTGPLTSQQQPREPLPSGINLLMSSDRTRSSDQPADAGTPEVSPLDVPVTLTVELGRVNVTLNRLADLKPGDVLELGRHSREPVELTSNGRLVARGELLLIDKELGVRVTHLFL